MSPVSDFQLNVKQNWCPGCGDFSVQAAIQRALANLGLEPHQVVIVSGIGCSSRLPGYINAYGFHSTHGRCLPLAQGVKLAKPELTVLACGGDGDGFAIGIGHSLHAMRRNVDLTYIVMDNHVYGLTKGQVSPRSDRGFVTKTSPRGAAESPIAALELALSAGAGFVAQGFSKELNELAGLIEAGIRYPGFSFINVFSPCVTFNPVNTYDWYSQKLRKTDNVSGYDRSDRLSAMQWVMETDGLATGILFERPPQP